MTLYNLLVYLKDNAIVEVRTSSRTYNGMVKDLFYVIPSDYLGNVIFGITEINNKFVIIM